MKTSSEDVLRINEIFGPTIQGEGPFTGQRAFFIRTSRCPLSCSFCDTPYTWAFTENKAKKHREGVVYNQIAEETSMSVEEVIAKLFDLEPMPGDLIVLTGGEPLLQVREIGKLVEELLKEGFRVQFETAGVISPKGEWIDNENVFYSVSPKLENSGNLLRARYKPGVIRDLYNLGAILKFVARDLDDLKEIEDFLGGVSEETEGGEIDPDRVWVMPEGVTHEDCQRHARAVIDEVLKRGWNFSMRVHVSIWGTERGR